MRQNLPLAMALESASVGQKDKRAKILRNIKNWLVQGYSLSESIKFGYPYCPGHIIATIAAAEKVDQLPSAIQSIENDLISTADEKRRIKTFYPLYIACVMITMFVIVLGLMTFVFPQFKAVIEEVAEGQTLPKITRILMQITHSIAYEFGWVVGLSALFIFYMVLPATVHVKLRPRRPQKQYLISRIGDFIKWHLPVLRWFEKNNSTLQVIEMLRLSLNSGCTVDQAIANTIDLDINSRYKKRLCKWLTKVEAGGNISDTAREAKLPSCLAWAFDDKVNQGNTPTILETLESIYRTNYNYRANFIKMLFGPGATVVLGLVVAFVACAIFTPIISIINSLTHGYVP